METQQQEIAEPDHRSQQVIEVVRDTAGELTDGLHFLRLSELDFKVPLFGHVDKMQGESATLGMAEHRCFHLAIVDSAEEQDHNSFTRACNLDLNRLALRLPRCSRRKLGGDAVSHFVVYQACQFSTDQILCLDAEQLAERTVCLLEPTRPV